MPPESPTPPSTPSNDPVVSDNNRSGSKKGLFTALAVVAIVLIVGTVLLAAHGSKKAKNTTTTKNGTTYVSNANDKNAAIKGVQVDASLKAGYEQRSLQSSDLAAVKKQVSDAGVSDMLTPNGSTAYGTTQQQGGDAVAIFWGTTSNSYNPQTFTDKLNAYAAQQFKQLGSTATNSAGQPITIHTTSGKTYQIPCINSVITSSGGSQPLYSILCQGTLGSSHAYISYSTAAEDQATAQSALTTFVAGSKVEY